MDTIEEARLYVVSLDAAPWTSIAGKRRKPGSTISLTAIEAEWELRRKTVTLAPAANPFAGYLFTPGLF